MRFKPSLNSLRYFLTGLNCGFKILAATQYDADQENNHTSGEEWVFCSSIIDCQTACLGTQRRTENVASNARTYSTSLHAQERHSILLRTRPAIA